MAVLFGCRVLLTAIANLFGLYVLSDERTAAETAPALSFTGYVSEPLIRDKKPL